MKIKLPKTPLLLQTYFRQLFHLPHLTRLNIMLNIRPISSFLIKYKILITITAVFSAFIWLALWYRGILVLEMNRVDKHDSLEIAHYTAPSYTPSPAGITPSPTLTKKGVLGTADYSDRYSYIPYISPTPWPTLPPLPTLVPTSLPSNNSQSGNNTGNPNCTTGPGVPNSWYSDIYPNPPVSTTTGSVTLLVVLRDCNKNTPDVDDNLEIKLTSTDPTARINGYQSPVTVKAQHGQATIEVSSQNAITDTFVITDTTRSFTVTDINNHNPSVTFSRNSSGNPNCTTGPGIPNFWYSDVSPVSPVSATIGSSVTFSVTIKDCNKNTVSASDDLTISQTSNDSGLKVNGNTLPLNIKAQSGKATFTVSSPNAGTVTLTVRDTTNSFTVTDANNHNPSVVFKSLSSPSSTPVPANPTSTPANTQTPNPTNTSAPIPTPTTTPEQPSSQPPSPTGS